MTDSNLSRATRLLLAGAFAGALASFAATVDAATVTTLYSFQNNGKDGFTPAANLTEVNGILYGTTNFGGTGRCKNGCGTIFSINPATGAEAVLHSFSDVQQMQPYPGSLAGTGGMLFGTTNVGGRRELGMLYSIDTTSDKFKEQYYFCNLDNCSDGEYPNSGLLDRNHTIFGTTEYGGQNCENDCGTVFSFDPKTRSEAVLHTFGIVEGDGDEPQGGLLNVNHLLYGATWEGGAFGYGTIFAINRVTGKESIVYSFCSQQNCTDGDGPSGSLIYLNHTLYGTAHGGAEGIDGYGEVFSIDATTHAETVLYSFGGPQEGDGEFPDGLTDVNGNLYGTTELGGANCTGGCGTVYSVDPQTGAETVIYSFCNQMNCADGVAPQSTLLNVNGTLYGVTAYGGTGSCTTENEVPGCGIVFAITP